MKHAMAAQVAREALGAIPEELAALEGMTVAQLRAKWQEVFGAPATARHRDYLRKRIAWRIQELVEGGLSERAKARLAELGAGELPALGAKRKPAPALDPEPQEQEPDPSRDPRLPPPGGVLRKTHKGVEHRVRVLGKGFEYAGQHYRSLSGVAKAITGAHWNGNLFFGLSQEPQVEEAP